MRLNKVIFIKNAAILTVTGLLIRFMGMFFRIWLAGAVGAEGIGLYSQIFSFYVLASAFASAGINTAVTRLVAEELACGNSKGVRTVLSRCIAVTLLIAFVTSAIIFFQAGNIAIGIIGDARAEDALRTLTLSLPFMGLSSCIKGYFIARKKTAPASSSQIFEQCIRISVVILLLKHFSQNGLKAACNAVIMGDVVAETCSFIFVYISFLIDKKKHLSPSSGHNPDYSVFSKLRHIALPITVGRYLNSILRTAENILVPKKLSEYGMDDSAALSLFGVIKGMALPLIFFPASFLNALSTLLIPEMSEAAASGKAYKVKYTAEKVIHITCITSFPIATVFFYAAYPLGKIIYSNPDAGEMIRFLSPIIPLMYLDSVSDGLLKGLDEQFSVFRNSMLDSLCRIGLIILILPHYGIKGFIFIMYISNGFTSCMNFLRLKKISCAKIKWFKWIIFPSVAATCFGTVFSVILQNSALNDLFFTIILSLLTLIAYLTVIIKFGCITPEDLK